ncbi:MAG: TonB-dependent receptor [Crocinitomicaceae bacterium]|nr:TonB-dependent receptor [Crocinitomicaceae bacterium]
MRFLFIFIFLVNFIAQSQVSGFILDDVTNEPIIGAKIYCSDGNRSISGFDGDFKLKSNTFPVTIRISMLEYINDTIIVKEAGEYTLKMKQPSIDLETVVISAGRRKQVIENVPVSMEIIRPQLIDNKGISQLDDAVDQSPGVFTMDGQVSIRGGSGYSYGAGSRVLLLWNGMPLLSGYAGDTQWNAIPIEQAAQVEIMKGASSVLYGSGALNGVIAITEKQPVSKPETKIKLQSGIYGNPRRSSLKWWSRNPTFHQFELYRSKMYERFGYTVSTAYVKDEGYREGETTDRGRISGTFYFRPKKFDRVKAGIGYNYQYQKTGSFLLWQSDSLAYTPQQTDTSSTLGVNIGHRLFIDPYLTFRDKKNNKHSLKTRLYYVKNDIQNNESQSSQAAVYFFDYQFQKQWGNGITFTSGITDIYNSVESQLMGNHISNNIAAYGQYEHHIGKFDIIGGLRLEYFEMDNKRGDSDFLIKMKSDTITLPFYPVLRSAVHYEIAPFTHLRASLGQGVRYPSVAERFTLTSVGGLNIFPNADLNPETGWAAELGIKQGVKIGEWKGMIDISGFVNQYNNMMEFTFGIYNPDSIQLTSQNIYDWIGFQAKNAEKARITGVEFSFNSIGSIGPVEIISLIGYTYMNPVSLNSDSSYLSQFSDPTSNMLKYRFRHLAKADIELNYKKISLGFSSRYSSFMSNIDKMFEEDFNGIEILPGLKEYRKKYPQGNLVIDSRFGYKVNDKIRVSLIANNILNAEYSSRPGDIQAPRNFIVQLQMKF